MKNRYAFGPVYEFHPSRKARDAYGIHDPFISMRGNVLFSDMRAAQTLAARINERRSPKSGSPVKQVSASELYATGLLHEIYHYIIHQYREQTLPTVFSDCDSTLIETFGKERVDAFLLSFTDLFPSRSVYGNTESPEEYLTRSDEGVPNRHIAFEELILVWLENQNPALDPLKELFDDHDLSASTPYGGVMHSLDTYFDSQPPFGPDKLPLLKLLKLPALASPHSIMGQLEFIVSHWDEILSSSPFLMQLLLAEDFLKEEGKYFLIRARSKMLAEADRGKLPTDIRQAETHGWGQGESAPVAEFSGPLYEVETERFTPDLNWMPRLVLMAKSTFVWLDQLSKQYGRPISRLDEIPDEELDLLARRGFTGLWLIGIWQRSLASQRIKHLHGNIEAAASAYSLNNYSIAPELGGEEAYGRLRDRAMRRGIRLASDMVPNHMGLDSDWVINHPDWFIQTEWPPYPNYTYNGPDLSSDDRVGIFIEDGYWRKTDAAVTFKRLDRWTGSVAYIYHGNDGTNMPWNDTAQLNFLRAEVREAVLQTILHVARLFPIIRFDAAMILAKKHFERLWFPQPGSGGAIPSRAQFAMTKEEFDRLMPAEFWREVVDRVQQESPDTLLLAEAFWLMEGYFVRTLGMHRVYNSAFMNMLKKEENANYRTTMKNVLEYNPQILKRHVNFMNNPDEESAIGQFGKDDKYFGACVLMITMPGLPMFGHGQIEGFAEKYGMEYRRAYKNEEPDPYLVQRHEWEIFPLLKKRYLFSDVEHFLLYDVTLPDGSVNEDVYAYSNRYGDERGVVLYNNKYASAAGWIHTSVGFLENGNLIRRTLTEGLGVGNSPRSYWIFTDSISGLEYVRASREMNEKGLYVELGAFKYRVFIDFREVISTAERPYAELCEALGGKGVPSIEEELNDLRMRPVHESIREALGPERMRFYAEFFGKGGSPPLTAEVQKALDRIRTAAKQVGQPAGVEERWKEHFERDAQSLSSLFADRAGTKGLSEEVLFARSILTPAPPANLPGWRIILAWLFLHRFGAAVTRDWHLERILKSLLRSLGPDEGRAAYELRLVGLFNGINRKDGEAPSLRTLIRELLKKPEGEISIGVHVYHGVRYFNKEQFEELLGLTYVIATIEFSVSSAAKVRPASRSKEKRVVRPTASYFKELQAIREAVSSTGYRYDDLVSALSESTTVPISKTKKSTGALKRDSKRVKKPVQSKKVKGQA